jgi:hypothetical protein
LLSAERNIRARLTWSRIYRATSYARSALWIVPLVAVVLVMMAGPAIRAIDRALGWNLLASAPTAPKRSIRRSSH